MGWPSFISWRQGALMMGGEPVLVPLADDGAYDLDAMLAAIGPRTKLVVVVSPNNPTGAAVDEAALVTFLDRLPPHVLPVLDEAYFEYLPEGGHNGAELIRDGRNLAVTRTFSKVFGLAGVRVGYLMAPRDLLGAIARVRNVFDVNGLAQVAAVATLREVDAHLPERVAITTSERSRVDSALRAARARADAVRPRTSCSSTSRRPNVPRRMFRGPARARGDRPADPGIRGARGDPGHDRLARTRTTASSRRSPRSCRSCRRLPPDGGRGDPRRRAGRRAAGDRPSHQPRGGGAVTRAGMCSAGSIRRPGGPSGWASPARPAWGRAP